MERILSGLFHTEPTPEIGTSVAAWAWILTLFLMRFDLAGQQWPGGCSNREQGEVYSNSCHGSEPLATQ